MGQKRKPKISKKISVIVIMLLVVLVSIISTFIFNSKASTYPEQLYYCTQVICNLFVIGGVLVAVWEYHLSQKSARNNLELAQVQKAIDLSEYYKDHILKYYPAIRHVFLHTGIKEILDNIDRSKISDFDKHELQELLSESQINKLKQIQESKEFLVAVYQANEIYNLELNIEADVTESDIGKAIELNLHSAYMAFMSNLINDVLNNMEFFALHFQHNTADESVVYQSLHKSYLEIIPYLYYYIASANDNSSGKLYTNVIWLYERWRDQKQEQKSDRKKLASQVQRPGTIIDN